MLTWAQHTSSGIQASFFGWSLSLEVTKEKAANTWVKAVRTGLEFVVFDSSGAVVKSSHIHYILEQRIPLINFGVRTGFWKSTSQVALFSFGLGFPTVLAAVRIGIGFWCTSEYQCLSRENQLTEPNCTLFKSVEKKTCIC